MKKEVSIEFENESFKGWIDEKIAIVKVKSNAFFSLVDIDTSRRVLDWFELVSAKNEINVILILNEKGSLGSTAYEIFVTELTGREFKKQSETTISEHDLIRVRSKEINILNSFIRATINYGKLVISGLNGTIFTPFFGASLAANYRFASTDMVISFTHPKYGIHPGGAIPFFLPKYIGPGRANQYLYSGGELSVENALELGLINKIVQTDNFEPECIKEAKILSELDSRYIRWTKLLSTPDKGDLIKYLREEEKYVDQYKDLTE
ncbi:MAG: enoyl-CoA hydratase/isomerase family protein [Ignavibacteria bacterium]|jgi:2-(1,2-epoxy-1,2-dihydrophenyl)acetyl-CoA isomerase